METNKLVAGPIDGPVCTIELVVQEVMEQINQLHRSGKRAAYIIIDVNTWKTLVRANNRCEYLWFGFEHQDVSSPDKLCGIDVALLTGKGSSMVIEVRE